MRKSARQYGPNRTTRAGISNPFRLSFPGRVTRPRAQTKQQRTEERVIEQERRARFLDAQDAREREIH
jgi:hypothetical protein